MGDLENGPRGRPTERRWFLDSAHIQRQFGRTDWERKLLALSMILVNLGLLVPLLT